MDGVVSQPGFDHTCDCLPGKRCAAKCGRKFIHVTGGKKISTYFAVANRFVLYVEKNLYGTAGEGLFVGAIIERSYAIGPGGITVAPVGEIFDGVSVFGGQLVLPIGGPVTGKNCVEQGGFKFGERYGRRQVPADGGYPAAYRCNSGFGVFGV